MRFLFGDHVLDTARRELSRGGEQIAVEPQVFDLLVYLLQNRERVVSKVAGVGMGRADRLRCNARQPNQSGAAQSATAVLRKP